MRTTIVTTMAMMPTISAMSKARDGEESDASAAAADSVVRPFALFVRSDGTDRGAAA